MSSRFEILPTLIDGVSLLRRSPLGDSRGYLERLFCVDELDALLAGRRIAQINRTLTVRRGTLRGMHFQRAPHAETKFVSCLRGEVFDVAVDLRRDSATFLRWHAEILSADNHRTMVIPEGCAHGLQTLTDDCELLYFHTAPHDPACEDGFDAFDSAVAIDWPLPVTLRSERDGGLAKLPRDFRGLAVARGTGEDTWGYVG